MQRCCSGGGGAPPLRGDVRRRGACSCEQVRQVVACAPLVALSARETTDGCGERDARGERGAAAAQGSVSPPRGAGRAPPPALSPRRPLLACRGRHRRRGAPPLVVVDRRCRRTRRCGRQWLTSTSGSAGAASTMGAGCSESSAASFGSARHGSSCTSATRRRCCGSTWPRGVTGLSRCSRSRRGALRLRRRTGVGMSDDALTGTPRAQRPRRLSCEACRGRRLFGSNVAERRAEALIAAAAQFETRLAPWMGWSSGHPKITS